MDWLVLYCLYHRGYKTVSLEVVVLQSVEYSIALYLPWAKMGHFFLSPLDGVSLQDARIYGMYIRYSIYVYTTTKIPTHIRIYIPRTENHVLPFPFTEGSRARAGLLESVMWARLTRFSQHTVHFDERTRQSFFVDSKGKKVIVQVKRNDDGTVYFELDGKKYAAVWAHEKRKR